MKKPKLNSLNELLEEIEAWKQLLNRKQKELSKEIAKRGFCDENGNMNYYGIKKNLLNYADYDKELLNSLYRTYSVRVDKYDYDQLKKIVEERQINMSSLLKTYWDYLIESGPFGYQFDYPIMRAALANRPLKNEDRHIAFALKAEENKKFKEFLDHAKINRQERSDIVRFLVIQFLYEMKYGSRKLIKQHQGWERVKSSHIEAIKYNPKTKILYMLFKPNSIYAYYDIPADLYRGLLRAKSVGHYHNENILGKYKDKKVSMEDVK